MWSWEFLCRWKHSQACMDQRDCKDFTRKYEFDGNSSRRLKLTKTLEICYSPKPLWKPWLSFVLVICVFPPAHVPIFCTQLPRDQMLQMLLSSPQQLIWPSRNWGMASSVTEWIDYPVGAPVVSQHVHTQCHWQKKKQSESSPDASPAEYRACFGGTFSPGIQSSLSCASKTCICMWSPDGLLCETSVGCSSILLHTGILLIAPIGITFSHFLLCHLSTCAHSLRIRWRLAREERW